MLDDLGESLARGATITANRAALVEAHIEAAFLGALLSNVSLLSAVPSDFLAEHFGVEWNPEIYRAIRAEGEAQAKGPVGLLVMKALGDVPGIREVVPALLCASPSFLPSAVTRNGHAITDAYRRRRLLDLATEIQAAAIGDRTVPTDNLIGRAQTGLDSLGAADTVHGPVSLGDAVDAALLAADEASGRNGPAGLSTGFPTVDRVIGGLEPGTLTILGGRPGMGKSAAGWQWAISAARQGAGVLAVSLEMSATELGRRALCAASGVPIWRLKRGQHATDSDRLILARRELINLPLSIEDGAGLTAGMIAMKARAAQRRHGLGLVIVDHLHIVRPDDADVRQGATWAVGRVSGAMKRLAKDCGCAVLLLAQLSRASEGRDDKRPILSDLRQAGDIEQDADAVAFLYRPEYYHARQPPDRGIGESAEKHAAKVRDYHAKKESEAGAAELIIAKVRDGEPGTVPLRFRGETASFAEASGGVDE